MRATFWQAVGCTGPLLILLMASAASQAQTGVSVNDVSANRDEEQLERVLNQRGSIDFLKTPLRDVVETISLDFSVPIIISPKKLEEAGISLDTPLTHRLQGLPLESILRLILTQLDLDFTIRDNVILISTPEDIESRLDTRVYPVLDLVIERGLGFKDVAFRAMADYDSLIELIISTIKPDSWDDVGGPGGVDALANAGSIVITQTREVHRHVENLLIALRRAKALQGIPSLPLPANTSQRSSLQPIDRGGTATPAQGWQVPQVYADK